MITLGYREKAEEPEARSIESALFKFPFRVW